MDINEIAARILREVEAEEQGKNPAAVELGRKGGLKGGKTRAAKMTPEERSQAARRAANARWGNHPDEGSSVI